MEVLGLCIPTWLLLLVFISLLLYIYLTWRYGELEALGIPHPPPHLLLGNLDMIFGKTELLLIDRELFKKYGRIFGLYEGRNPTIVVADVEIIKQIMVKDFNNFINRRPLVLRGPLKLSLFDAEGDYWKYVRRLSSPAFSSGKLKYMFQQIKQCAHQLRDSLQKKAEGHSSFEAKSVASAFTMDVIAATGFGLQIDSQKNVNNTFNINGRKFFDSLTSSISLLAVFLPGVGAPLDKLGVSTLDRDSSNFFTSLLKQAMKQRKESAQSLKHTDFLQLMMDAERLLDNADEEVKQELKEGGLAMQNYRKEKGFTEDEIIAQYFLFFLAGYETTATAVTFLMYELAKHPEIQDKVFAEVQQVWEDKDELDYDDLNRLKYLYMCIQETLRIYPPIPRVDRRAHEEVIYKGIKIPKDYVVSISITALHYDPDIWPEPEKFDPERFSPEAKAARDPYHWLPFGAGPRLCIGMRLALLEIKMAIATTVKHFKIKPSIKLKEPLKLANKFIPQVEGGMWLDVEHRK